MIERLVRRWWLPASLVGIVAGAVLYAAGARDGAHAAWAVTSAIGILPIASETIAGLLRREFGVDVIAVLALAGSLVLGEYLAGAVIALMLSSGRALESFADSRAHRELSALLERAPRRVTRYEDGELVVRPIDEVRPADRLFVKTGEVVPVDGLLLQPEAY